MTRVYLIRHAQAEGNQLRRFQGVTDADITETGKAQLAALTKRCADYHFDTAYSSPLKRAYKTALAAVGDRDIPIHTDERLLELNIGEMENVPFSELPVRYADDFRTWTDKPQDFDPPGGESMRAMRDRIVGGFLDIVRSNRGKSILVVSHGCAMRSLICTLTGVDFEHLNTVEWCDNTAVYIIDFDDELNATFVMQKDISHLPDDIATFSSQTWWRRVVPAAGARILGVDYGDARTGLSLSDEGRRLASPAGTVKEADFDRTVAAVAAAAKKNNCCEIVVGLPLNMNGSRGPRAEKAEVFGHTLERESGISVYFWDERLSTVGAAAYMNETDFKGKKRKNNIDAAAACVILQGYLDYLANKRKDPTTCQKP